MLHNMRGASGARTIELPPLQIRAAIGSVNQDERTVEVTFSTGAGVERYDWQSGKRFLEKLEISTKAIRLERLNAGASVLDSHSAWSVGDILGSVVPDSARVVKGEGVATLRFSRREAVDPVWMDVSDGHLRFVSVGYRVHKFIEDAGGENRLPVRTAVDWEPYEISMVAMPADAGAKVRAGQPVDVNTCVIETRSLGRDDADRLRRFRLAMAAESY